MIGVENFCQAHDHTITADCQQFLLGFVPKRTIEDAVSGLIDAFQSGKLPNSMTDVNYFNIKAMQLINPEMLAKPVQLVESR